MNNINFELLKSGLNIEIYLDDKNSKNSINGVFKSKILNTNLKFNFIYDENSLNIYNSFFRGKNLSFKNKSLITLEPFLDSNSKFEIEDIDLEIFKQFKLDKLLKSKDILKQINTKNEVSFKSKKFNIDIKKDNEIFNLYPQSQTLSYYLKKALK